MKPVIRAARAFLITSIDPVKRLTELTLQWSIITSFINIVEIPNPTLNYSYTTAQRIKLNDRRVNYWLN